jgi:predicted RNA methylase
MAKKYTDIRKLWFFIWNIERLVATRGLTETIKFGLNWTNRLFQNLSPSRRKYRAIQDAKDLEFDRKFGVETAGILPIGRMNVSSKNWIYAFRYQPIGKIDFAEILKDLRISYEDFVFIDLGSGKGRAILLAASLPFKKIIGVEFCEELNRIARENINRFPCEARMCGEIELICMDASEFCIPDQPLVLYLYNPFGRPVMARVVENVAESFRKVPRRIIVLYYNPEYSEVWEKAGFLNKIIAKRFYHIYDTKVDTIIIDAKEA